MVRNVGRMPHLKRTWSILVDISNKEAVVDFASGTAVNVATTGLADLKKSQEVDQLKDSTNVLQERPITRLY